MQFVRRLARKAFHYLRGPVPPKRLAALQTAIEFSVKNNVEGDYLEFGVFEGESFVYAYHWINDYRQGQREFLRRQGIAPKPGESPRFFAFDSFEGLPAVVDRDVPPHWRDKAYNCSLERFLGNLKKAGVDPSRVIPIQGYYNQSLTGECRQAHAMKRAAIVHIDCDLYESTVDVLNFVGPLLVDGSVIVFDDWFYYRAHPNKGERGAFSAWLKQNPQFHVSELVTAYPAAARIINLDGTSDSEAR